MTPQLERVWDHFFGSSEEERSLNCFFCDVDRLRGCRRRGFGLPVVGMHRRRIETTSYPRFVVFGEMVIHSVHNRLFMQINGINARPDQVGTVRSLPKSLPLDEKGRG